MKPSNIIPLVAKALEISSAIKPTPIVHNASPIIKMNLFTANTLKLMAEAIQITSPVKPIEPFCNH
jgi:hypothetical protein